MDQVAQGGNGTQAGSDQAATGQRLPSRDTVDSVALATYDEYNPTSVSQDLEYAGLIYTRDDGGVYVTPGAPGTPCTATKCGSDPFLWESYLPKDARIIADWHTHGAFKAGFTNTYFSPGDVAGINADTLRVAPPYRGGYLGTPLGTAQFYSGGALRFVDYSRDAILQTQRFVGYVDYR